MSWHAKCIVQLQFRHRIPQTPFQFDRTPLWATRIAAYHSCTNQCAVDLDGKDEWGTWDIK